MPGLRFDVGQELRCELLAPALLLYCFRVPSRPDSSDAATTSHQECPQLVDDSVIAAYVCQRVRLTDDIRCPSRFVVSYPPSPFTGMSEYNARFVALTEVVQLSEVCYARRIRIAAWIAKSYQQGVVSAILLIREQEGMRGGGGPGCALRMNEESFKLNIKSI